MKTLHNQLNGSTPETLAEVTANAVMNLILQCYPAQRDLQAEALTQFVTAITGSFAGFVGDRALIELLQQLTALATQAAERDQAAQTH